MQGLTPAARIHSPRLSCSRSRSRFSRRVCASRSRRRSVSSSTRSGGTCVGRPSSSSATIVMYALLVCRFSPVPGRSASTRTPTSIDVFHAAFTDAQNVTRSPRFTGSLNVIRSTPAVTTRRCACRIAASPAASSHIFITTPPCTKPAVLLSSMLIQRTSTDREADAGTGSTRGNLAPGRIPCRSRPRLRPPPSEVGARRALRRRERQRSAVGGVGLLEAPRAGEQLGSRGVQEMEALELRVAGAKRVRVGEAGGRALGHPDRGGAVELDDRRGGGGGERAGEGGERAVEGGDLAPVGVRGARRARVQAGDRGLDLVRPRGAEEERAIEQ